MPDTSKDSVSGKVSLKTVLMTLLIGAFGALTARFLHVPAPYLTGPAIAVSMAGILGANCAVPVPLRDTGFVVIGLSLGSSVTPEVLTAAKTWPASLIIMCSAVAVIMVAGGMMFERGFGLDRKTALLASSPGHLSYVLGYGADIGANVALISVIQSLRVLMLTLLVPAAIALFTDADVSMQLASSHVILYVHLVVLIGLGAGFGFVLKWFSVPAAFLLGGMIISSLGHGSGLTPGAVPPIFSIAAFIGMGTLIGTRFSGVAPDILKRAALGGVCLTVLSLVIASMAAVAVALATGLPMLDLLIAYAPGGLETMVAMGAVLGADIPFVAFHHVARLLFLSVFVPLILTVNRKKF